MIAVAAVFVKVMATARTRTLLLLGMIGSCMLLQAQTTGEVRINAVPKEGMQYVLDGKYRMSKREVTLTEGDHRFIFWAPEHAMLDTSIFVMGNYTLNLNVRLRRPVEYVEYRQALDRYEQKKRLGQWLPPVIAATFTVWTAVNTIRLIKADKDLRDLGSSYSTLADPAAIQRLKYEQIPQAKDDLRSIRTQTYISSGLLVASIGAIAYIKQRQARSKPPVFQDTERIRFEGLVWIPGPAGGTWASGITIPIK